MMSSDGINPSVGIDPAARSRARRRALQAVYAWQISGNRIEGVIDEFRDEQDMRIADLDYFEALVRGVAHSHAELDAALAPFLDREIERVDQIERAALRIAAWELRERIDVPYRVVINEAVEATKRFGSEHGHTYVNGVLDKLAGVWRSAEYAAAGSEPRRGATR
jgi:N utilization substance protein B